MHSRGVDAEGTRDRSQYPVDRRALPGARTQVSATQCIGGAPCIVTPERGLDELPGDLAKRTSCVRESSAPTSRRPRSRSPCRRSIRRVVRRVEQQIVFIGETAGRTAVEACAKREGDAPHRLRN